MMTVSSREQVYKALFTVLETSALFKVTTRRLKHWKDVPKEDQPALFMEHTGEAREIVRGQPPRIVLEVTLWVYVSTDGSECGPILNPLLDNIEGLFEPALGGDHTFTLGGLVHHCWIEGQTQIFEGDLGDEAVATIPVKLLVT